MAEEKKEVKQGQAEAKPQEPKNEAAKAEAPKSAAQAAPAQEPAKGPEAKPQGQPAPQAPKKERPANCAACNKSMKDKRWYYRSGKYYCTKRCWRTAKKKDAKPAEAKAEQK